MEETVNNRPIFTLAPRLMCCADMVRKGAKVVDIGTDHAYLPIWLAKQNIIEHAIAADLRQGPLDNADTNIRKYRVEGIIETRLSNGLDKINENEADDIIIAGMGGELISNIILGADWLKNPDKRIILQPMTSVKELRVFLDEQGFSILREVAVFSEGKVYTVMYCWYTGEAYERDELYPYIGMMMNEPNEAAYIYVQREIYHIKNKIKGLEASGNSREIEHLKNIVNKLNGTINK